MKNKLNLTDEVEIFKLEKIINIYKKQKLKTISFETLIASCFKDIYRNIMNYCTEQYTKGYIEGVKDERNKTN